jgi:hypothetical protein
MSEQTAGGDTGQNLPDLLNEILADLQSALSNARNMPAKKLLQQRIDRLRRAIDATTAAEPRSRSTANTDTERLYGT